MRPFSGSRKFLVLVIILSQLAAMCAWHWLLVHITGLPIIFDVHKDEELYYRITERFASYPPFGVTISEAKKATGESVFFGYQYILAIFWTISSDPVLAMRIFKLLVFFAGLGCLARVWLRDFGERAAFLGFIVLSVFCTTAFYYNFRNLKDGLLLSFFMIVMAILDTIFQPARDRVYSRTILGNTFLWGLALAMLLAITTIRFYLAAMVICAIVMHIVIRSDAGIKGRITGIVLLSIAMLWVFKSNVMTATLQEGEQASQAKYGVYGLLQAFLSPIPWSGYIEKSVALFHCIYLLFLPYAIYAFFKHLRDNIDWHLFLYVMTMYVAGVITSDPHRKRLIIYPIMLVWILRHLSSKWQQADETLNSEDDSQTNKELVCQN